MTPHRTPQGSVLPARHVAFPGPRDALDTGSVSELVEDCRGVPLSVALARPWPVQHHDIVVPTGASSLLEGLGSYGS